MLKNWLSVKFLLVFVLSLLSGMTLAETDGQSWQWHGFATQGVFYSDHNNVYGPSESVSADFRELAVNAVYPLTDRTHVAGQLMSRRAGSVNDGTPRVDYLLFDHRFVDSLSGQVGLRLGRIKNPFGFYNETRDVAFTRSGVMLPQAIYFDIARDLQLSSDGIALYGSHALSQGWLDYDLLIGKPNTENTVEYAYLSRDWPGAFDDGEGFMWRAVYNAPGQRWLVGVTMGRFDLHYTSDISGLVRLPRAAFLAAPRTGHINIDAYLLSAQYNLERWSFTTEVGRQKVDWRTLGGAFAVDPENYIEAGYLQAEYRFNSRWSVLAKYEALYLDTDDRNGQVAQARLAKPAHTQYARDWTLGIAWKPTPAWLLRMEWHCVRGTAWLPEQDNPDQNQLQRDWQLLALQATYRF